MKKFSVLDQNSKTIVEEIIGSYIIFYNNLLIKFKRNLNI